MISRRGLVAVAAGAIIATAGALIALRKPQNGAQALTPEEDAPDFSVALLGNRGRARLADFSGKILLLNFWATWCGPCRVEMPWLMRTNHRYGAAGLRVLGVNMDDGDMPNVERYAHELNITYPIARSNDAIVGAYGGVRFLPQSILIGRQGQIVQRSFGMPPPGVFEAAIETALARA